MQETTRPQRWKPEPWANQQGDVGAAVLKSHAGKIVKSGENYYITTCGWPGYDIPFEGGMAIAELEFLPE